MDAERKVREVEEELEDLSQGLFEQANEMVRAERIQKAELEKRVKELEDREKERGYREGKKGQRLQRIEERLGRLERVRVLLEG